MTSPGGPRYGQPMAAEKNSWIAESERTVVSSPVMEVIEQTCRSSEDERQHNFYILRSRDWANIIPVTEDGKIVLVKQYRIGIARHTVEIPGGVADSGETDAQVAAIREMTEETGYVPLPGARCLHVGTSFPNPAIQNNRVHSFVIGPVRRAGPQKLDSGEMIEVIEVPIHEIPKMLDKGAIDHALIANAFLQLAFRSPSARGDLIQTLGSFSRTRDEG